MVATIGPKPSLGSEHIEEEFTDGILKNKTYLVRLLVAHRDVGEMINITQRNIGELFSIMNHDSYSETCSGTSSFESYKQQQQPYY